MSTDPVGPAPIPEPSGPGAGRQRRMRSDAGRVRLNVRDLGVFGWLTEMKVIYEADIADLLTVLPTPPCAVDGHRPSEYTVRGLVARWQRAEVVNTYKLIAGRSRIVRLTARGAAVVGVTNFRETSEITAYHQCEVSRLRLYLHGRPSPTLGQMVGWESERMFRADLDALGLSRRGEQRETVHVPDGVATYASGDRVAVEVERSVKAPSRLVRILEQLLTEYPVTLYAVAGNEIRNAVGRAERAARQHLATRQVAADRIGALTIIDLPDTAQP